MTPRSDSARGGKGHDADPFTASGAPRPTPHLHQPHPVLEQQDFPCIASLGSAWGVGSGVSESSEVATHNRPMGPAALAGRANAVRHIQKSDHSVAGSSPTTAQVGGSRR